MSIKLSLSNRQTVLIKEPLRNQFADNLGGAVEFGITHSLYKILEIMGEGVGTFAGSMLVKFLEIMEPELVDYVAPLLDEVLSWEGLPDNLRIFFTNLRNPKDPAAAAILGTLGSAAGGAVVGSVVGTLMAPVTYFLNNMIRPARGTPGDLIPMVRRGLISEGFAKEQLRDGGWDEKLISAYFELVKPFLSISELSSSKLRGIIEDAEYEKELSKRGYNEQDIAHIEQLLEIIPPVNDLISMAVREAFNPTIIKQFKLDSEFPSELAKWSQKMGLSDEWSKKYWIAHWQLPSLMMGYEMLHRGIIEKEQMQMLIKAHDVSPYWRDKLIDISYSPYTRVDTRRMSNEGILSPEEVLRNYMDIGYDEEKATNLTVWTLMQNQSKERDLSRSDILIAFREARISEGECLEYLVFLGYDEEEAELLLSRERYRKQENYEKERVKTSKILYESSQITQSEVYEQLGELNLDAREIEEKLKTWDVARSRKTRRPTLTQLRDMFFSKVITEDTLKAELSGYGYSDKYIDWFIAFWKTEE